MTTARQASRRLVLAGAAVLLATGGFVLCMLSGVDTASSYLSMEKSAPAALQWVDEERDAPAAHRALALEACRFGQTQLPLLDAVRLLEGVALLEDRRGVPRCDDLLRGVLVDTPPSQFPRRAFFAWALLRRTGDLKYLEIYCSCLAGITPSFVINTIGFDADQGRIFGGEETVLSVLERKGDLAGHLRVRFFQQLEFDPGRRVWRFRDRPQRQ